MRTASDAMYELLFCFFLLILGLLGFWEFVEWCWRGPAEEPAPRVNTSPDEPSEWEKLTEDEREYLRWFHK